MIWIFIFIMALLLAFALKFGQGTMLNTYANTKEEFIRKFGPIAKKIAKEYDIDYRILIAQAGHETGWGKRVIDNNFFNIKATNSWIKSGGKKVSIKVKEYIPGKGWIYAYAHFRAYSSPEESIRDFIRLIKYSPRYSRAWAERHNPEKFFEEIQKAGYATDPGYAAKLKRVYASIATV